MRAAVVPSMKGKWEVQEVTTPEPGPNEVLVKIHASGLCYTDVHQTTGELPGEFPRILGHEPVGEIIALGPGVVSRKVGDRVGMAALQGACSRCEWCLREKPLFCQQVRYVGFTVNGGHAEYMLASAEYAILLPDKLPYEQAAPIFCAGYTVWSGLRWADPKPHERVAVVGIGGLGHLAVQYAKAAGFETIAVTHSKDKDKLVRELGADDVVADGDALSRAGGADVILATSNSMKAASEALKGLRPDGRLIAMGFSTHEPLEIPSSILFTRARIVGSQQNGPEYLYEALDYVAKGKVKVMEETYQLSEINRAYERVADGKVRFRAVIVN